MGLYRGKLSYLNDFLATDPSYKDGVWCRYHSNKPFAKGDWDVELILNTVDGDLEVNLQVSNGVHIEYTSNGFMWPEGYERDETFSTQLGMDTACIYIGCNESSKEMTQLINDDSIWDFPNTIRIGADGLFGNLWEGLKDSKIHFILIMGLIPSYACCSEQEAVNILENNLGCVLKKCEGGE